MTQVSCLHIPVQGQDIMLPRFPPGTSPADASLHGNSKPLIIEHMSAWFLAIVGCLLKAEMQLREWGLTKVFGIGTKVTSAQGECSAADVKRQLQTCICSSVQA